MSQTKDREDLHRKIFAMFKQRRSPQDIARTFGLQPRQVGKIVRRLLQDQFDLTGSDQVRAAVAFKEEHLRRLNERLVQVQKGLTEISRKESARGEEISESEKFYVAAEVSLLREIRTTENEINQLQGLLKLGGGPDDPDDDEISVTIKLDEEEEEE